MLTHIRNLDYVILLCEETARMKVFYHEILGFPIHRDWGDWLEMRVGEVLLTLRPRGRPHDGPKMPTQLAFNLLSGLRLMK